jgi:hypothetical protein
MPPVVSGGLSAVMWEDGVDEEKKGPPGLGEGGRPACADWLRDDAMQSRKCELSQMA